VTAPPPGRWRPAGPGRRTALSAAGGTRRRRIWAAVPASRPGRASTCPSRSRRRCPASLPERVAHRVPPDVRAIQTALRATLLARMLAPPGKPCGPPAARTGFKPVLASRYRAALPGRSHGPQRAMLASRYWMRSGIRLVRCTRTEPTFCRRRFHGISTSTTSGPDELNRLRRTAAPPIGAGAPQTPFFAQLGWGTCAPGPAYRGWGATDPIGQHASAAASSQTLCWLQIRG
jgi:hypothetical protein